MSGALAVRFPPDRGGRGARWFVVVALAVGVAHADPETDADQAFRAASQHAVAGDPGALDAYEALGAARPVTRWTDDAWLEAGRLAVRAGAYDRARHDLEQAIAVTTDEPLARRARGELDRVSRFTGGAGQWTQVAADHERVSNRLVAGGDPKPALRELEALVEQHPGYPRAADAMILIAQGWQRDGEGDRAIAWLRRATSTPGGPTIDPVIQQRVKAELVRALITYDELGAARHEIEALRKPSLRLELERKLASAERRRALRWVLWGLLAVIAGAAIVALRRSASSWRDAMRRLSRPPIEAVFFVPIAVVLVIIAETGNPLVARAVSTIAIGGAIIAWVSGVIMEAARARRGAVGLRRATAHGLVAALAVASMAYLAIDHHRMLDLVLETWREGPTSR